MTLFLDLAVELVQEVASYLDIEDQASVRAACKYLQLAVDPLFFVIVLIPSDRLNLATTTTFLEALESGNTGWSKHGTVLAICPLDETAHAPRSARPLGRQPHWHDRPEAEILDFLPLFASACRCLVRVKTVRLELRPKDPQSLYDVVFSDVLPHFPLLAHFELRTSNPVPIILPQLSNLSVLKIITPAGFTSRMAAAIMATVIIANMSNPQLPSFSQQAASIVARSPHLRVLHLVGVYKWDDVWTTLLRMRVRLAALIVHPAGPGLLPYLESYSGLEELTVQKGSAKIDRVAGPQLARAFFDDALPQHAATLKVLRCPLDEDAWSFSPENAPAIARMVSLVKLDMSVRGRDLDLAKSDPNGIANLLLQTIRHLPDLRHVAFAVTPAIPWNRPLQLIKDELNTVLQESMASIAIPTLDLNEYHDRLSREADRDRIDSAVEWHRRRIEARAPVQVQWQSSEGPAFPLGLMARDVFA
ncbi:hypothetical protein C8F01DRAFT_1122284 [Mycena amicta]|nr:hypothetical protein C8F01DRAFT_1122284 [Mycena amicta]